jgi:hypothetical protein
MQCFATKPCTRAEEGQVDCRDEATSHHLPTAVAIFFLLHPTPGEGLWCSTLMHSKVSDWLPSYIKAMHLVVEKFKMAGYFPDRPCITTVFCALQQPLPLIDQQLHLTVPSVVTCTMLSSIGHVSVLCLCWFLHAPATYWLLCEHWRLELVWKINLVQTVGIKKIICTAKD